MKVYPFKIPKPLDDNLILQINKEEIFYNKLHQHGEIQISYINKGSGTLVVANSVHSYKTGDLFVIGSNLPHVFLSDILNKEDSHMITLFFTLESFGDAFFKLGEFSALRPFFTKAKMGFKINPVPSKISQSFIFLHLATRLGRFIFLMELLEELSRSKTNNLTSFIYPKEITDMDGKKMQLIFDHVMNNFQQEISLQSVADLAYMTPNAFCRYFKQRTNKTFFQFLIELRIANACKLLIHEKELPIEEVSIRSGFNNLSNFNRKFKELMKTTPNKYRMEF